MLIFRSVVLAGAAIASTVMLANAWACTYQSGVLTTGPNSVSDNAGTNGASFTMSVIDDPNVGGTGSLPAGTYDAKMQSPLSSSECDHNTNNSSVGPVVLSSPGLIASRSETFTWTPDDPMYRPGTGYICYSDASHTGTPHASPKKTVSFT